MFGPYLWTDSTASRSDGLSFVREDFDAGGKHPVQSGMDKIAAVL